jgi:hypothetical protein
VDAGKTWRAMGLADGRQIAAILVDPRDSRRVFVAVVRLRCFIAAPRLQELAW